jgi:hypothetical protein
MLGVLSQAEFSSVLDTIYDCAFDPGLWPDAICEVCRVTNCTAGTINVSDIDLGTTYFHRSWNRDLDFLADGQGSYIAEVTELWSKMPNLMTRPLDDPMTGTRELLRANSGFFNKWVIRLGYSDTIQLLFMRRPDRIGALELFRHISAGEVSDQDLDVLRLLAPHIRRAVAICERIKNASSSHDRCGDV